MIKDEQMINKKFGKWLVLQRTEEEVKEIYLSDLGCATLSKKYNVSKTNIRYIKNKQQWKWLTDTFD